MYSDIITELCLYIDVYVIITEGKGENRYYSSLILQHFLFPVPLLLICRLATLRVPGIPHVTNTLLF